MLLHDTPALAAHWAGSDGTADTVNTKLPNAALISPLWQGDACLGLSGLYAIVNAIRMGLADRRPLNAKEVERLFAAGMRFTNGRLTPEQATVCGLRVSAWRAMAEALVEHTRRITGVRLVVERLMVPVWADRLAAFATLGEALLGLRVPLMLLRGGHYTVVSGITRSSLLLFDSRGACWVSKRVCGVSGDCDRARHLIYPSSFLALSV